MAAPSQRTLCAEGNATPPMKRISRSAQRTTTTTRRDGPSPIRHPVCSRQCDNIQSSRHLLGTYPATTVLTPSNEQLDWKTISTSGDRTFTLSLPLGSPKMILGGLFPESIRRASATLLWGDGSSDEPYASQKARHVAPKSLGTWAPDTANQDRAGSVSETLGQREEPLPCRQLGSGPRMGLRQSLRDRLLSEHRSYENNYATPSTDRTQGDTTPLKSEPLTEVVTKGFHCP